MTDHISDIKGWFELAVPTPNDKNRAVQIGVHLEEVGEMANAIGEFKGETQLEDMADHFKVKVAGVDVGEVDRPELLDALCDQIVTAVGVAHMFGMDIEGALAEVTRSNYSKFVDGKPVFDANGKIAKPPSYSKPNLEQFV
ncbi:MAG: hypothetical protein ACTS8S_00460 [Giesbergeria sp.]